MDPKEKIKQDLNTALKGRKELEVSVLRQLLAAILNKEKEKRFKIKEEKDVQLTDEETMEVISSEAKKRRESIVEFGKGKRQDLVEKEKKELEILEKYLPSQILQNKTWEGEPEQLSEEEIKTLVKVAIEKVGAKEMKDLGKVMQELIPQVKGKA
ncbi:MAG: hypothetical protein COS25_01435, partial [Candidatus Nealsonbacteria bacterium CG02_land_8_20_14_3_00_37_10]